MPCFQKVCEYDALLSETYRVLLNLPENVHLIDEFALKGRLLGKARIGDRAQAFMVMEQLFEHLLHDPHGSAEILDGFHQVLVDAVFLLLPRMGKRADHLIHP
mmetsp:Transcript_34780/g.68665  ORF Transcript_34780/g.68665 Transcript_34780/m.68665 type:complete len:103 (+) Transcript_34780:108-416(+)